MDKKYRILIAKVGTDIHERGALTIMNVLRDAGYEVIYTGRFQSEVAVAKAAIAEDVDLIGISDHTGSFPIISKKVLDTLKELGSDIPLFCGGLMTDEDIECMKKLGVVACYPAGCPVENTLEDLKTILK